MEFRSVFISDLHLGSIKSHANKCSEMLKICKFQNLYIVGDFIDVWQLKRKKFWPQEHTDVLRKILKRSKTCKIVYVLGNHDEFLGNFLFDLRGDWGNIIICERYIHTSADNKKYLVIHGHQFDYISKHAQWVAKLGDIGYETLLLLNKIFNKIRQTLGFEYWSLSAYVKSKFKDAVNFISNFEEALVHFAEIEKVDGVIAGHIHKSNIRKIKNILYLNCGDWVESLTMVAEDFNGQFQILELKDGNLISKS